MSTSVLTNHLNLPTPAMFQAGPPKTTSVEDAFRPAFEEISRRASAARAQPTDGGLTHFSPSSDGIAVPFAVPEQDWVLLSLGTAVLAPRPVDASRPAVRVYGAFPTREDAKEHAEVVRGVDPACSLVLAKRNEWVLLPLTEAVRDDPPKAQARLEQKLQAHRVKQAEEGDAFDRAVREKTERPAPKLQEDKPTPEEARELEEAEGLVYKRPPRLRAGAEVRGQGTAVVCVIPDEFGECLVKVLGCFENTTEADAWVRNVASRHVTDDDVFVTPTCDWFYPNAETVQSRDHYRNDELQRIMDAAARNPQAVRDYKEWKKEQEREQQQQAAAALPALPAPPVEDADGDVTMSE